MTDVFVDTSALYAALDADDEHHGEASEGWARLLDRIATGGLTAHTHSGVVVEVTALVQRRLGLDAARALHDRLLPVVEIRWLDQRLHERALAALLAAGRRDASLVDWTSFELMRELRIDQAFAFDDDFAGQGFVSW
ncbi:MAG: PIN domain-containing protein [Acidimicrobiia bacterium]|nr:PIN domain-containing protein [Acidimicrobiia bacterium]